jgi:hypothetical protein
MVPLFPLFSSDGGGEWRITDPGQGYKPYPLFTMGKLLQHLLQGPVLKTLVETIKHYPQR